MPQATTCPSCGARLNLREELIGRRVKCPKCGETFQSSAESSTASAPAYVPPALPKSSPQQDLSPGAKLVVKTGIMCAITGVLGLVLPLVGLQVRALNNLGDKAPAAAIGLIVVGGVLTGLAYVRRYVGGGVTKTIKWIVLGGAGAVVLLIALLVTLSMIFGGRRSPSSFSPSSPTSPPRAGPTYSGAPRSAPSPNPGARDASDFAYDSMVRQYGAEKVWRVVMPGQTAVGDRGAMHSKIARFCSQHRGTRFMIGDRGGTPACTVAPIEQPDAEGLAQALDLGAGPASVDVDQRTLMVKVKS